MDVSWQAIGLIMATLLALGYVYDLIIAKLQQQGYAEGFTSLLVAGGVGFTLVFVAIIDLKAALLTLAAFCCSGLPMIFGSISRYVKKRAREQREARNIGHANTP